MEIVLVSDLADAILQTVQKLGVYFPDRGKRKGYSTFRKPGTNKGGLPLSETHISFLLNTDPSFAARWEVGRLFLGNVINPGERPNHLILLWSHNKQFHLGQWTCRSAV